MDKDFFGMDIEEFRDCMSRVIAADICLRDMGRNVRHIFAVRNGKMCYPAGRAFLEKRDLLGNVWTEPVPLYLCHDGFMAGDEFFSFGKDIKVETDFDPEKFRRDVETYIDICAEEARRIDGDRGVSYIMYGLYCLRVGFDCLLSWGRFRQLEF